MNITNSFKKNTKNEYHDKYQHEHKEQNLKKFVNLLDKFNLNPRLSYDEELYYILSKLSKNDRLSKTQSNWLFSHGNSSFLNSTVSKAYFQTEAIAHLESYKESNSPCTLIDAANCYISANNPQEALQLLVTESQIKDNKNQKVINFYYQVKALAELNLGMNDEAYESAKLAYAALKENIETTLLLLKISVLNNLNDEVLHWLSETKNNGCSKDKIHEVMKESLRLMDRPRNRIDLVLKLFSVNYVEFKYLRNFLPKKLQSQKFGCSD